MITINIKPNDTLFFRNNKPFSMGDETWADGTFPPYPSVIYGALRTAYFSKNIDEFRKIRDNKKLNDDLDDPTTALVINKYSLNIDDNDYFPVPLDFNYIDKSEKNNKLYQVKIKKRDSAKFYSNHSLSYIPDLTGLVNTLQDSNFDTIDDGLILKRYLEKYLKGSFDDIRYVRLSEKTNIEPKVGIARNFDTRTTEQAHLYRVGMYRMHNDLSISISFFNLNIDNNSFLKLGGEGKSASYQMVKDKDNNFIKAPQFSSEDKHFKLYLSTPAVFEKNGWLPDCVDNASYEGILPDTNAKVRLIAAFIGKAGYLSGFDMKDNKPKPMLKTIPSGSVYYFEIIDDNPNWDEIKSELHGKSISSGDYNKQGFGISYIGKFNI
jgi:CRISPR-associated protein Cmr3